MTFEKDKQYEKEASVFLSQPPPRVRKIVFWVPSMKTFYDVTLEMGGDAEIWNEIVKTYNAGLRAQARGED